MLLLACAAFAGDALNEYKFVRSAKSGGIPAETLAIRFDNTLYKNTNADYSNILITDSDGNTVPFAVCDIVEYAGQSYSGKITGSSSTVAYCPGTCVEHATNAKRGSINIYWNRCFIL